MELASHLEAYLAEKVTSLEDSGKALLAEFVDFATGRDAKIADAVSLLESAHYTVIPPAPTPTSPQAPS